MIFSQHRRNVLPRGIQRLVIATENRQYKYTMMCQSNTTKLYYVY